MNAEDNLYFQSVGIDEKKSFEEIRIEDYIKSYQTTGRPPLPVPSEPKDEIQRKTLGLPPLFKAHVARGPPGLGMGQSTSGGADTGPKIAIVDPALLPLGQEFRERVIEKERYQTMAAMAAYTHFSHEEMRFYAYARGHKTAPVPVNMVPFASGVPLKGTSPAPAPARPGEERLQNLCAQPGYEKHSPEEFRVAFLLFGREMTSTELLSSSTVVAPPPVAAPHLQPIPSLQLTAPAASMSTSSTLSAVPSAIPRPIFSAAASTAPPPSTPRFTFGLR